MIDDTAPDTLRARAGLYASRAERMARRARGASEADAASLRTAAKAYRDATRSLLYKADALELDMLASLDARAMGLRRH